MDSWPYSVLYSGSCRTAVHQNNWPAIDFQSNGCQSSHATRVASSRYKQPQIKFRGKAKFGKGGKKFGRKRCTVGRCACWPRRQRPASSSPPCARPPPRSTPSTPPPSKPKPMYRSHPLLACLTVVNLVRSATQTLAAKGLEYVSARLVWKTE